MAKVSLSLSSKIYDKASIDESLKEFEEVLNSYEVVDDSFLLELDVSDEYDSSSVAFEFQNYVLGIINKSRLRRDYDGKCLRCEKKTDICEDDLNCFVVDDREYVSNFFRFERLGNDRYLITNEESNFLFLSADEFDSFKSLSFDGKSDLIDKLLKNHFIFEKGKYGNAIAKLQDKKFYMFQGASLHIMVVTLRCNLKCLYCHASAKGANESDFDMSKETAKEVVDRIFESPSIPITIEFQGGEPLINFELIKFIVEYAKKKNESKRKELQFALVSNLMYMTDEILKFLMEHNVGICTSIDGPKEVHDFNRKGYDKTIYWVDRIKKKYEIEDYTKSRLNALVTISKYSLGYPKEIVDEYLKWKFPMIHVRFLNALGDVKKNSDVIYYSAEEFVEFWKKVLDYIIEKNIEGYEIREDQTYIILLKLFDKYDPNYGELRSPCGAVSSQLLYNYDGNVYGCDEGRMLGEDIFKLGVAKDSSYVELTTNDSACAIVASSINDTNFCDKCVYKPYCGVCPVMNYATSGSVVANVPNSFRCKILKEQFRYILEKIQDDEKAKKVFDNWILKGNK